MRTISPVNDEYQYFFGYYDLMPFDSKERMHLAHRVRFMDRLPRENDVAELGAINLNSGAFIKYAETAAWNFQQGAMLRYIFDDDHIIYNVRDAACKNGFGAEIRNLKTGETRRLCAPVADVSRDGRYALSLNFRRIFDFRPGYGYPGAPDPYAHENAPEEDGVFLMDISDGSIRKIIDYTAIREAFPSAPYSDGKLVVNHITFNPSGDRFLFLLRNFPEPGRKWKTQLITSDLNGHMRLITDYCLNSHYAWKNDREILIVSTAYADAVSRSLWLMNAETGEKRRLPGENPLFDIHCLYDPDRRYIIGDSYPAALLPPNVLPDPENATRSLWLLDTETGYLQETLRLKTVVPPLTDLRCDLHARFSPSGNFVSFDSTHTGKRTIELLSREELGL